ncbi:putative metalloprotease protein [Rosellinia necatrix]|uniref:Putative metalloprotease protein n=1 Tax=Rosellinia necatrix TaxID=77044 RepID=A0A1S7UI40_ROSNE|nr:putative metalloprotease protein [Rosellinia necatrix]
MDTFFPRDPCSIFTDSAAASSILSRETVQQTASEHISLSWPDDYISVDPGDFISRDTCEEEETPDEKKRRVLFRPQVTVNVFNTGGSSRGGSGAGGDGTGGSATVGDGYAGNGYAGNGNDLISTFASQLAALSQKVEQLTLMGPKLTAETGAWSTENIRPWDHPQQKTEGRVNFVKTFKSIPTVMTSITSADVSNSSNFRVKVYATAVDIKGFTVVAETWWDTKLYSCGVSWTAIGE